MDMFVKFKKRHVRDIMFKKICFIVSILAFWVSLSSCTNKQEALGDLIIKKSTKNFDWLGNDTPITIKSVANNAYLSYYIYSQLKFINSNGDISWSMDGNVVPKFAYTDDGILFTYTSDNKQYLEYLANNGNELWNKGPYDSAKVFEVKQNIYISTRINQEVTINLLSSNGDESTFIKLAKTVTSINELNENRILLTTSDDTLIITDLSGTIIKKIEDVKLFDDDFNGKLIVYTKHLNQQIQCLDYDGNEIAHIDAFYDYVNYYKNNNDSFYLTNEKESSYHIEKYNNNLEKQWSIQLPTMINNFLVQGDYFSFYTIDENINNLYKYDTDNNLIFKYTVTGGIEALREVGNRYLLNYNEGTNHIVVYLDSSGNELLKLTDKGIGFMSVGADDLVYPYKDTITGDIYIKKIDENGKSIYQHGPYKDVLWVIDLNNEKTMVLYKSLSSMNIAILDKLGEVIFDQKLIGYEKKISQNDPSLILYTKALDGIVSEVTVFSDELLRLERQAYIYLL